MEYNFREIEQRWQQYWKENTVYTVSNESTKPKCYVLDMFPYPSGAGLHVGHPLGYIASDIYSRYKRLKGFNVLHPMGFDSFGLPAEQYALETGQHPAETTARNIETFKSQLDKIGFCYDWSREVQTSDPNYYKWTQWIFLQLFNSYFCNTEKKALPISMLVKKYEAKGAMPAAGEPIPGKHFTADQWNNFSEKEQQDILMKRRLAYSAYGEVNWCEALGTVLANDEVVNGVSERGGHPVIKKKMRQWYLRITAYADRLLEGLETVNFSDAMKEMQRNWIGKSSGAEMEFNIKDSPSTIKVYTTRPDTIFGVDFLVLAPEHELVQTITTTEQCAEIEKYLTYAKSRSDRERQSEVKQISGCFTGAYAWNPFDGKQIPIWIAEYVLAGYGTGAIMAVPCGDQRDFLFAKHFNIPITNIIGEHFNGVEANATKEAVLQHSGFLDGLLMKDAIAITMDKIEEMGIGKRKLNYKMRDAGFSRQRYWGEPFPIKWIDGVAVATSGNELPVELPHV
ncbi:MAG: class I tRNA ligase family protein, partial [Ferruginibacter sp.]